MFKSRSDNEVINTNGVAGPGIQRDGVKFKMFFDEIENRTVDATSANIDWMSTRQDNLTVKYTCNECNNSDHVYHDAGRGEIVCLNCGNIVTDHSVDYKGVRVYDQEDFNNKVHYEPMRPGCRPILKYEKNDPDSRRRERENNRIDWSEKKVMIMHVELQKLKGTLPFSKRVEKYTMNEVKKVFKTDILRGRNAKAMGLALLYYSSTKCNSPIGLSDIIEAAAPAGEYEKKRIRRSIRSAIQTLSKEMGYKFYPKTDHSKFLTMVGCELDVPQYIMTRAIKWLRTIKENIVMSGDPRGYVGACLYHACKMSDDKRYRRITQSEVASVVKMTEVTIRKRTKELKFFLERKGIVA